jgi:uncharacterized membrane protein
VKNRNSSQNVLGKYLPSVFLDLPIRGSKQIHIIKNLELLLSLNSGQTAPASPGTPLEDYLKIIAGIVAVGAEISAGLVIGVGVLIGIVNYVRHFFQITASEGDATEVIRLRLGRILALGLEFTVASDILCTAVAPTRQDILNLGAIVLLRTLLNYFLE